MAYMTFLHAGLLFGLVALVVPPIVHFFSRKKYDVVVWPAMQFLQFSPKSQRKVFFEQFWLMMLRMALLGLLVAGLSAPTITSTFLNGGQAAAPRDVVVLIDGSASMSFQHNGKTADQEARKIASSFLGTLNKGDRVAVLQVKQQPANVLPRLSTDIEQATNALELLTPPRGTADWPTAVQAALNLFEQAGANRDVVLITDYQHHAFADESTLGKWELLRQSAVTARARFWIANAAGDRPSQPPNWCLDPLTTARGVIPANREVTFKSTVRSTGSVPPVNAAKVQWFLDGLPQGELPGTKENSENISVKLTRKFPAGSHLITFQLENDALPTDNRQDYAIDVLPSLPVLIIDGGAPGSDGGGQFLRDALAPAKDPSPSFSVKMIRATEWTNTTLATPPRVLILTNIEKLSTWQQQEIERYLTGGGSVLVTLGDRCDAASWNRVAFRAGQGFLPARLVDVVGDDKSIADAPMPLLASFSHPATEVFKQPLPGGLHTAYFPKRWKLDENSGANGRTGNSLALLSTKEPLLVERSFGKGQVIVSAHPLDASWKTNLIRLPDFVRLAHELVSYLAAARSAERNLLPGQPIIYSPRSAEALGPVTLLSPDQRVKTLNPTAWPLVVPIPAEPGAYKLTLPSGRTVDYAVQHDVREANLKPCEPADIERVAGVIGPIKKLDEFGAEPPVTLKEETLQHEFWWLVLLLVLLLFFVELWMTKRLNRAGEPAT
jgi:von Willebrand factor type A domain/Aerotolerance regulator N-terminal